MGCWFELGRLGRLLGGIGKVDGRIQVGHVGWYLTLGGH